MSAKRLQKRGGVDSAFSDSAEEWPGRQGQWPHQSPLWENTHPLQSHRCGLASAQPNALRQ